MFERVLVNRKFEKRSNLETRRSISFGAIHSPHRPAKSTAPMAGTNHSAARTVPLTAQAHQNEAKLKSDTVSSHPAALFGSTNMKGDPKMVPPAINTRMGSN